MYKYLPSKKFSFILLSIVLAAGIIYLSTFLTKIGKTSKNQLTTTEVNSKVQEFMSVDSDNDGMKDWEEALWKTDPKKADTDGDGTDDGEEIKLNRDPLKPNINPKGQDPSDKVDEKVIAADKKAVDDFSKLTATEKMGRELFSQYIATRKIDTPLSETEKQQIVENTLSNLPPISFKTYTEKEIKTTSSSSNEALRIYSNYLAEIILTSMKIETENIDTIITDYSNITNDEKAAEQTKEIFKRFDPLIAKNKKTVAGLLNLNVPQSLLTEHLNLLNSIQEIYESLDMMQKSSVDPIILVPLLNHYDLSVENLTTSLGEMTNKLISLRITYPNKTDYGYVLFDVIMFKK